MVACWSFSLLLQKPGIHIADTMWLTGTFKHTCCACICDHTLPKESLATPAGEIVDPESAVKFETRNELKVYSAQT